MMKQYDVEITETLQITISVEANSREEALTKVKEKMRNEEVVLDSNDYIDTEYIVTVRKKMVDSREIEMFFFYFTPVSLFKLKEVMIND